MKNEAKIRLSVYLLFGYAVKGLQESFMGPILPDLSQRTGNTLAEYGSVFTVRAFGYVFGALLAKTQSDQFDLINVTSYCFSYSGLLFIAFSVATKLWHVCLFSGIGGGVMGFFDTAANAGMLKIWKENEKVRSTALHFMHTLFALGGLINGLSHQHIT